MKSQRALRLEIRGIVQGVGMRPFLHRLARQYHLEGWARNTSRGVELEIQGEPPELESFQKALRLQPPPLALIQEIVATDIEKPSTPQDVGESSGLHKKSGFSILPSRIEAKPLALIPPDTAPCPACLRELADPKDRRFRYPFINCTDCGPRYTIVHALPYDRSRTSMAGFPMCPDCAREYGDVSSRRYHAQPDCCPVCGPQVYFLDQEGQAVAGDPFLLAQRLLAQGGILAVKGIGGIHLACDPKNPSAVARLRQRKHREEKPLALMCADEAQAETFCHIHPTQLELLKSPRRPIVLLEKRDPASFQELSSNCRLGIMLPYSPLHVLLLDGTFGGPESLVMTSANPSGCPVLIDERKALSSLKGIADGFLFHNRPIENRCDDSLVMEWQGREYFFRRSRGYCPYPVSVDGDCTGIAALGAQLKASFALGRGNLAFLSPHIGDLTNMETLEHFKDALEAFQRIFGIRPRFLACDLHPDYTSSSLARRISQEQNLPLLTIQHHWAHMASCMADNCLDQTVFGIIWDGTGLGDDSETKVSVWGAEFLAGDFASFHRLGSIRPISLAGGDQAVLKIRRLVLALFEDCLSLFDREDQQKALKEAVRPQPEESFLLSMIRQNISCTPSSSMGRLFDAVDSLLESRHEAAYDGQAAAMVEALGESDSGEPLSPYPLHFYDDHGVRRFDTRFLILDLCRDLEAGLSPSRIARRFMDTMAAMALNQCCALNQKNLPVVLSGGVFQNYYLLQKVTGLLSQAGYTVFCHRNVPPNDQGIALGQLAIAQRSEAYHVSCCTLKN